MLAINRKRKASPSGLVDQSKRTALTHVYRACCHCVATTEISAYDSQPFTIPSCIGCGHKFCWNCRNQNSLPGTFHPNPFENLQEEPLTPSLSLHPGPVQRQTQALTDESRDDYPGLDVSAVDKGQEHEMDQDVESQAQELQPLPTTEDQQVEARQSNKRSLNMNKCERCRLDKKKCLPVDRVWPAKCELCIKKGFPCSESKRVVRSTKHAPTVTPSPTNAASPSTTSISFEDRLEQWTFLTSYHKMMMAAVKELKRLNRSSTYLFNFGTDLFWQQSGTKYYGFIDFVDHDIPKALRQCTEELLALDLSSQNLPGWFLTVSLNQYEVDQYTNFACSDCYPTHPQSTARVLESSQDACSQLLLLQHHLISHDNPKNWQQKHADLSLKVVERASATIKSFGSNRTAEYGEEIGVYHPDHLVFLLSGPTEDSKDCLERSLLHLRIDDEEDFEIEEMLRLDHDALKLKDKQDILGRTVLLIACRQGWNTGVEILLEQQADPGLATVYGSLPLHYAAAMGSTDICKKLLAHKTRFDMKAEDCMGKTALDWAEEKRHQDVVELLSAEYAAADREEELRRSSGFEAVARSFEAGVERYNAQRPYLAPS